VISAANPRYDTECRGQKSNVNMQRGEKGDFLCKIGNPFALMAVTLCATAFSRRLFFYAHSLVACGLFYVRALNQRRINMLTRHAKSVTRQKKYCHSPPLMHNFCEKNHELIAY